MPLRREAGTERAPHRPTGPVPWVLIAADAAYAWQSGHGLIKLPDSVLVLESFGGWSLAPDGTILRWQTPVSPQQHLVCHLRLVSGAVMLTKAPGNLGEDFYGPNGTACQVENFDQVNGVWQHSRYAIRHDGTWRQLRHELLMRSSPSSPGAQFSPDGNLIAITVLLSDGLTTCVEVIDLRSGTDQRYVCAELLGTGAWSPDGKRLLVQTYEEPFRGYHPAVIDLETGATNRVAEVPDRDAQVAHLQLLGWIDDRRLLGWRMHARRLGIWAVDVLDGQNSPLAEMRSPVIQRDLHYILMAPGAVQASPHMLISP